MKHKVLIPILCATLTAMGCRVRYPLASGELYKLDGYRYDNPVTLKHEYGGEVTYSEGKWLFLYLRDGRWIAAPFESISFDGIDFRGVTMGEVMVVSMADIERAEIIYRRLHPAGKAVLIFSGVVLVVYGIFVLIVLSNLRFDAH